MKIQSPPGMRDFYPDDMRLQNWLFDHWRSVSRAFGFQEYEGPIFEHLDLYTLKSGDEIVSQLFNFEDRGGRRFAIRPEMTPTLARMVAARANSLPRPIKWFSIPRMCRAEKPQRGRLREFFQWNADILGVEDPLADAEVIAVAVEFFRRIGLDHNDIEVQINSRPLAAAQLGALGVPPEKITRAFELIDRQPRLPAEEFARQWDAEFSASPSAEALRSSYLEAQSSSDGYETPSSQTNDLFAQYFHLTRQYLNDLGLQDFYSINKTLVRGLGYYTGVVFEIRDRARKLRALAGGGRYDDLTSVLDGPRISGVGFGMGDVPVLEVLRELGRLPAPGETIDVFVIDADGELFSEALRIVGELRRQGVSADFSYKRTGVGKQFKQAAGRGARFAIVVGEEFTSRKQLTIKNLASGEQRCAPAADVLTNPQAVFGVGQAERDAGENR